MTTTKLSFWIGSTIIAGWLITPAGLLADTSSQTTTTVVLDVATDATTLAYSRPDAATTGVQRGDTYVVSGFVYGGFSIPNGDTTDNFAPDPAGSIGTIVMSGIFGDDMSGNPPVITSTHVFSLVNADGLITQGLEGSSPQIRALLGGTGQYSGAVGQVTEEILGSNWTGGYNLRFTFNLVQLNPQDNSATQAAKMLNARIQQSRSLHAKH